jgi:hypothetical protein
MSKIPVGATIAQTYRFVLGNLFPILGLIWASWAMAIGAEYLLYEARYYFPSPWLQDAIFVAFYVLMFFLIAMQAVALSKRALKLKTTTVYAYLTFEPAVWRLFLAFVLLTGLLASAIAAIAQALIEVNDMPPITEDLRILAGFLFCILLLFCALMYILLRLSFFLAPVCVVEQSFGLLRSWQLSRRNFWQSFVIWVCVFAPTMIGMLLYNYAIVFRTVHDVPSPIAILALRGAVTTRVNEYWYLFYPANLALEIIFVGLVFGAQCFAYRALMPAKSEAEAFR